MRYAKLLLEGEAKLLEQGVVAIDFETNGGGVFGELKEVYGFSYARENESGWVELNWKPGNSPPTKLLEVIGDDVPVFHNASFDIRIAREMGINLTYYHDTLVLGYLVNPNISTVYQRGAKPSRYKLAAWGYRLKFPKMEHPDWNVWHKSKTFRAELGVYAVNDAELTLKLYRYLARFINRDEPALRHYQLIERPFIEVIIEMSSVGFFIDNDALDDIEDECMLRANAALEACRKIVSLAPNGTVQRWRKRRLDLEQAIPEFGYYLYCGEVTAKDGKVFHTYRQWVDFTATDMQISWALQMLYDWEPTEFTEGGKPKVSADILSGLEYPLIAPLLELAETQKMISTYTIPFKEKQNDDGYVVCSWNQTVTKTGRLSSSSPNLQNLPARTELGGRFRAVVCAPDEYDIVGIDLSQIEYRVMAALQYDYFDELYNGEIPTDALLMVQTFVNQYKALTEEEKKSFDIHTTMANLWGVPRKVGKNITFANMFGAGNKKLAKMVGCTFDEAKGLMTKAQGSNPSFKVFQKAVWSMYEKNNGIGHTYYGRRLVYQDMTLNRYQKADQTLPSGEVVEASEVGWRKASAQRQSFNARIQGTAADVIKLLTLRVLPTAWGYGARLVASVHDEIIFYCPKETSKQLGEYLSESFRRTDLLPWVPVEGESGVGNNWREIK